MNYAISLQADRSCCSAISSVVWGPERQGCQETKGKGILLRKQPGHLSAFHRLRLLDRSPGRYCGSGDSLLWCSTTQGFQVSPTSPSAIQTLWELGIIIVTMHTIQGYITHPFAWEEHGKDAGIILTYVPICTKKCPFPENSQAVIKGNVI